MKKFLLFLFSIFLLSSSSIMALPIKPDDAIIVNTDNQISETEALDTYLAYTPTQYYKMDFPSKESGTYAGFYKVIDINYIENIGNSLKIQLEDSSSTPINTPEFLSVKDGNNPIFYIFDLGALGWDGKVDLELSEFWPVKDGAFSHVAFWGTFTPVPEPATMLLLGTGLIGLSGLRRKFKK